MCAHAWPSCALSRSTLASVGLRFPVPPAQIDELQDFDSLWREGLASTLKKMEESAQEETKEGEEEQEAGAEEEEEEEE